MLPARQEEELDALLAQALSEGALTESAVDEITDSIARGSRSVGGLIQELRPRLRTPPPKAPNRKARRAHLQQHGEVGGGGGEVGGLMAEMEALLALAQDTSGGHDSAAVGEGDEAGAFDMSDVLRDVPSADGEGDGLVEGGVEGIGAGGVEGCGEEGGGGAARAVGRGRHIHHFCRLLLCCRRLLLRLLHRRRLWLRPRAAASSSSRGRRRRPSSSLRAARGAPAPAACSPPPAC
mmetsp:Transcript_26139/g.83025  ORF Transcript_26139/g.83025 Transcript_26139/m.83025 type:complete len:236 (-) Transcript_26139:394-1101(-)